MENKCLDTIYHLSTYGALFSGNLDGFESIKNLKEKGDFGIGGITGLDGEVLIINNEAYHFDINGDAKIIDENELSPKMIVSFFNPNKTTFIEENMNYQKFTDSLINSFTSKNVMYAIKFDGYFKEIQTKCYPKQNSPYNDLTKMAKERSILDLKNIYGTLVGFYIPEYLNEVSGVDFHFHFISMDKKNGGHVIDFILDSGTLKIDAKHKLQVILPNCPKFYNSNLSKSKEKLNDIINLTKIQ